MGRAAGMMAMIGLLATPVAAQVSTTRVSTNGLGVELDKTSKEPSPSADGRFVAFTSAAGNLPDATSGIDGVYVKDRQTGEVTRVSVRTDHAAAPGLSGSPDISADGRYVAFTSTAVLVDSGPNLCGTAPGHPGPNCTDVYVHDRTTGQTTRVSVSSNGTQGNSDSFSPQISADGRYVVFASYATNLVAGDSNACSDIFLHDRQTGTTTRVSTSATGVQGVSDALQPTMSDDASVIAFASGGSTVDLSADTLPCASESGECWRIFEHVVATGVTRRVPLTSPFTNLPVAQQPTTVRARFPSLSADGKLLAVAIDSPFERPSGDWSTALAMYSSVTGVTKTIQGFDTTDPVPLGPLHLSANGRTLASCVGGDRNDTWTLWVMDTMTGLGGSVGFRPGPFDPAMPDCDGAAPTADGITVYFSTAASFVINGDTNTVSDVFAFNRDADGDGMPSDWELTFGLNPNDPGNAGADPDNDGLTNLQEYQAATHPFGLYKQYLAEGADNAFFSTEILVFNPNASNTNVVAHFLGQNGSTTSSRVQLLYARETGLSLARYSSQFQPGLFPDQAFSTVIESDAPVAVDRSMSWGGVRGVGYGSHAESGVSNPSMTWYFAEGATHGSFSLFYLLQNPNSTEANVTIQYLLPSPQPPVLRNYTLAPNSRLTIPVDDEPGLGATDVSARIDANVPIFAERAMYMSTANEIFAGGHDGAGITQPAARWFVAEGSTGGFFDMYILIGNPSPQDAAVTIRYLLPDGTNFEKPYTVAHQSRLTIGVDGEDPRLAGTPVSAVVTSTGANIVVERAMWWPSPNWYEGSLTMATTETGTRWALAGGYLDPRPDTETYLLIANPNDNAVTVTIDIGANGLQVNPQAPNLLACRVTVPVPGRGRYTTGIRGICPVSPQNLQTPTPIAGTIVSEGGEIVVERATYWSVGSQFWGAGESTLLTKLPVFP